MDDNTAIQHDKPDSSWYPVIFSVVVFPGIGQWMQRRRVAAWIYIITFSLLAAVLTWIIYNYVNQVIPIVRGMLMGEDVSDRQFPPIHVITKPSTAAMIVYIANIIDVLLGRRKLIRSGSAQK